MLLPRLLCGPGEVPWVFGEKRGDRILGNRGVARPCARGDAAEGEVVCFVIDVDLDLKANAVV